MRFILVLLDQAPGQSGDTDSHHHQDCVRKKTEMGPAEALPNLQARLFDSWVKYERKEKTAAQLLKTCSCLNGPARGK